MKINITTLYVFIMLPIVLGYMERRGKEGKGLKYFPSLFLLGLMVVTLIKGDNLWGKFVFQLRRLFM